MNKCWITTLCVLLMTSPVMADKGKKGGRQGGPDGGQRLAKMQQVLGLSDEQVTQMREIRENGGSRKDMRAILTDDQKAIMDERRAEHRARRGKPRDRDPNQAPSPTQDLPAEDVASETG